MQFSLEKLGLFIVAVGILFGFLDLKGAFKDKDRQEILNWVLHSNDGMPIKAPAAKKFMQYFPPPGNLNPDEITHLTKLTIKAPGPGPVMSASVNYMKKNAERTAHVATLAEIGEWASETSYQWVSWGLTLLGFLISCGGLFLKYKENQRTALL
jgi:hypothetical protein